MFMYWAPKQSRWPLCSSNLDHLGQFYNILILASARQGNICLRFKLFGIGFYSAERFVFLCSGLISHIFHLPHYLHEPLHAPFDVQPVTILVAFKTFTGNYKQFCSLGCPTADQICQNYQTPSIRGLIWVHIVRNT